MDAGAARGRCCCDTRDLWVEFGRVEQSSWYCRALGGYRLVEFDRSEELQLWSGETEFFRVVVEQNPDAIVVTDETGVIRFLNRAAELLLGNGSGVGGVLSLPAEPDGTHELEVIDQEGNRRIVILRVAHVQIGGTECCIASLHDATEEMEIRRELRQLSYTDDLTQLKNRRGFLELAERRLRLARGAQRRAALFLIDLMNLKSINDQWGHSEGDRGLIGLAEVVERTFRASDAMGRLGGDEFAVLAVDASRSDIPRIRTRLKRNFAAWNAERRVPYELQVRVGVAVTDPLDHSPLSDLLARAGRALAQQKQL